MDQDAVRHVPESVVTWPWAKPADAEETKATMDALDKAVNPDYVPPVWSVTTFCVNCNTQMQADPAKSGRRICFGCNGVVEVVAEKWSQKWGKGAK